MDNQFDILTQKLEGILADSFWLMPEVVLLAVLILVLLVDLIQPAGSGKIKAGIAILGVLVHTAMLVQAALTYTDPFFIFSGYLMVSSLGYYFQILVALTTAVALVFSVLSGTFTKGAEKGEFYLIILGELIGMQLLVMASNLLILYLSLECVSISSYLLATFGFNKKSSEGGLKYFLYGAFSSGIMLYGMSILYGITGNLNFSDSTFLASLGAANPYLVFVAILLTLSGVLFKISTFPFHTWTPDVYEGSPTPVVAFFSVAPKAAAFALFIRFIYPIFGVSIPKLDWYFDWSLILSILAIITLTIGNFAALRQTSAKRLLAYSSIAHAGFVLMAVVAFSPLGVTSVLFYLTIYFLMNFAAFYIVDIIESKIGTEEIARFNGIGLKLPFLGVILLVVMIALTGLPPTAGFYGKLFVFSAVWEAYELTGKNIFLCLFLFGLANTVISLYYYLKIPYFMFFRKYENKDFLTSVSKAHYIFLTLISIPLVFLFLKPDWLINIISNIKL
ncbi:MAG TPA: NADH-quinone oxidoreductase subunit N [Cytophagaceae bacterium]